MSTPTANGSAVPTGTGAPEEPDISDLLPRPGGRPADVVRHEQVVLTDVRDEDVGEVAPLDGPVDLGAVHGHGFTGPGEGVVIGVEERWIPRGVALGRLLHSVALAPGESTRIAVTTFDRSEAGRSTEDNRASDTLAREDEQTRRAEEHGSATARETAEGSSATDSTARSSSRSASAGFSSPMVSGGGQASSSTNSVSARSVARSTAAKEATTSAVQDVQARTRQTATAVRSQTAAVVRETSQREASETSTRVVTNYNHMHALTVCYYEVVQQYDVVTVPVRVDRCVFVPMSVLTFTDALLQRYASVLAAAAPPGWGARILEASVDRSVETPPGAPLLDHISAAGDGTVVGVTRTGALLWFDGYAGVPTGSPVTLPGNVRAKRVAVGSTSLIYAIGTDSRVYRWDGGRFQIFGKDEANEITCAADGSLSIIGTDGIVYALGETAHSSLSGRGTAVAAANGKVWHTNVGQVWIGPARAAAPSTPVITVPWTELPRPGAATIAPCADGTLWVVTDTGEVTVGGGSAGAGFASPSWADRVDALRYVAPVSSEVVWGVTRDGTVVRIRTRPPASPVLAHLNRNAEHYSRAVWAGADEITMTRMLAHLSYAPSEPGEAERTPAAPLVSRVDPHPVAVTGNYVAFRWQYPREHQRLDWLRRAQGGGATPLEGEDAASAPLVVSLPSGGVFAEAVLGRSNAAEKLDITRFWDWQDSPIPILPPEIAPVSTASRARDVDLARRGFDGSAASLGELQALPVPAAMSATVQGLTATIFRDMSGLAESAATAQKALADAAAGERAGGTNALEANKAAMAHYQKMTELAITAAEKLGPMMATGGASGAVEAGAVAGGAGGAGGRPGGGESSSRIGALLNQTGAAGRSGNGTKAEAAT